MLACLIVRGCKSESVSHNLNLGLDIICDKKQGRSGHSWIMGQFHSFQISFSPLSRQTPFPTFCKDAKNCSPVSLLVYFLFIFIPLVLCDLLFVESSPWLNCQRKWMLITKDHSGYLLPLAIHVILMWYKQAMDYKYSDVRLQKCRHAFSNETFIYSKVSLSVKKKVHINLEVLWRPQQLDLKMFHCHFHHH